MLWKALKYFRAPCRWAIVCWHCAAILLFEARWKRGEFKIAASQERSLAWSERFHSLDLYSQVCLFFTGVHELPSVGCPLFVSRQRGKKRSFREHLPSSWIINYLNGSALGAKHSFCKVQNSLIDQLLGSLLIQVKYWPAFWITRTNYMRHSFFTKCASFN